MKRSLVSASVVLSMIMIFIVTPSYAQEGKRGPIKLGAINNLTGPLAALGVEIIDGIKFALEEAKWQVAGRKVELIVEDSGTDLGLAKDKARKLVELDGVCAIFNPLLSTHSGPIAPYCAEKKVINLPPRNTPIEYVENEYYFLPVGTLQRSTCNLGLYSYDQMGARTCSSIELESQAGYGWHEGFVKAFEAKGGKMIQTQYAPRETTDFAPYLTRLKKADVALLHMAGAPSFRLVKQYHEFGLWDKMPVITYEGGFVMEEFLDKYGDPAIGIIVSDTYSPTIETDLNRKFVKAFQQHYGKVPFAMHYCGYLSTIIVLAALKATDGDTTPEKLYKAMKNVSIETPTGHFEFGPRRCGRPNIYVFKVVKEDGKFRYKALQIYRASELAKYFPD
jgi:branched-chain amino acid transport system substrate-binding protein